MEGMDMINFTDLPCDIKSKIYAINKQSEKRACDFKKVMGDILNIRILIEYYGLDIALSVKPIVHYCNSHH